MRDSLPIEPNHREIGILNLDSVENNGTHWTLFYKNGDNFFYFDSFGHHPPREIMEYFKNDLWYSTFVLQDISAKNCGQLCVILAHLLNELGDFPRSVYKLKDLLPQ